MTPVFADAYYFFALLNPNDEGHRKADEYAALVDRIVTSEWVLLELADGLSASIKRSLFREYRAGLLTSGQIECVPFDMALHARAIERYHARPDKTWSLTDCVSFLVMEGHGLKEALTADHHFEQAGFVALLK
jgi:predicted nucleic acid-binding protein